MPRDSSVTPPIAAPSSDIPQVEMKDNEKEGSPLDPDVRVCPSYTPSQGGVKDEGCRKQVIASADLLRRSRLRAEAGAPYWGLHIRPGIVTQIVGETSAGKTVFLHNLGRHLAGGEEFLGFTPPRPLRVLHIDFESYDAIYEEHLAAIGVIDGWDFLDLDAADEVQRGPAFLTYIATIIREGHYDVAIFDPLMDAYPVNDENDNATALKQMLAFRRVARETKAAIILAHNSGLRAARKTKRGKTQTASDKFLGRGATMRVEKADVSINFTELGDRERLLTVTKARGANKGDCIQVRFAGKYGYELIDGAGSLSTGSIATMQNDVMSVAREETAAGRLVIERKTFMARLNIEKHSAREQTLDRALKRNVDEGQLDRVPSGGYRLKPPRDGSQEEVTWQP